MYKFIAMYQNYGIEVYSKKSAANLQIKVDKTYVDIAYIIYLENFKSFDYSVGSKGICDLSAIIEETNEFNLISDLNDIKKLSTMVQSNLNEEDMNYEEVNDLVNNYLYAQEVFDQRLNNYKAIYNEEDIYTISQYRFELVNGVSYDSYIDLMNNSKRAGIEMLGNFISNTYQKLIDTLSLIVE